MRASVVKVEEVVEAENSASDKIAVETVEAMDLPCMYTTTPGIIKRRIDGQERITQDFLRRKGVSNLHRDFFVVDGSVFILQFFCHEALCHKISLETFNDILAYQNLTFLWFMKHHISY